VYFEAMVWSLGAPSRTFPTTAAAILSVVSAIFIPHIFHLFGVQPDWARHGIAAGALALLLTAIMAITIVFHRVRGGGGFSDPYLPHEPFAWG
jgi:hypothetical protein